MTTSHFPSNRLRLLAACAASSCLSLAGIANGAVIINHQLNVASGGAAGDVHDPSTSGSPDQFSASSDDLAAGVIASVTHVSGTGSPTSDGSGGIPVWTDGSISTVYNGSGVPEATAHAAYGVVHARVGGAAMQTLVTFDLGGLFDLTRVDVYTGWSDSGRDDSSFILLVSADNVTFTPLISYAKPTPDNTGAYTTPVTNLHSIVDDGAADIASAVRYVQLEFNDADNGYAGLLEVDVFGTAVPEPASALLLGLGGLAALRRRRA